MKTQYDVTLRDNRTDKFLHYKAFDTNIRSVITQVRQDIETLDYRIVEIVKSR